MGIVMGSLGPAPNISNVPTVFLMLAASGFFERNLPSVIVKITLQGKPGVEGCTGPLGCECFVHDPLAVFGECLADEG